MTTNPSDEQTLRHIINTGETLEKHGKKIQSLIGMYNRGDLNLEQVIHETNLELDRLHQTLQIIRDEAPHKT